MANLVPPYAREVHVVAHVGVVRGEAPAPLDRPVAVLQAEDAEVAGAPAHGLPSDAHVGHVVPEALLPDGVLVVAVHHQDGAHAEGHLERVDHGLLGAVEL
eukprot:6864464-Alexandrium_andersonii.AAC.1